jgi:hypothetical protein
MTEAEFNELCEEVATESANENWDSRETLRSIAAELNSLSILFQISTDATMREIRNA